MFEPRALSKAIREKKRKAMRAEPELVHSDATVDMNPIDAYNMDQRAQMQETVGSPEQIDARDKEFNNEAQQESMSHQPMKSKMDPADHGTMAYGGMVTPHEEPSTDVKSLEREYVGGSPESNQEMSRRFMNGPSVGSGEGQSEMLGSGLESEEDRRIKMRKMRLSAYMDTIPLND